MPCPSYNARKRVDGTGPGSMILLYPCASGPSRCSYVDGLITLNVIIRHYSSRCLEGSKGVKPNEELA